MVRIKHRYLLVQILYPDVPTTLSSKDVPDIVHFRRPTIDDLTPALLSRAIKDQIGLLYGDYGVGITAGGLTVKYLSPATSTFIVRCPRSSFRLVWGAITLFTHVPLPPKITKRKPIPCVMRVVRVSGTIKKSEEEAIRRARADILKAKRIQRESGVSIVSTALDAIFGTSGNSQSVDQEGGIIDEEDEDESQTEMID